ncbi:hypothetical protein F4802DRAFT_584124 [Xylaria palmicola]|nr:hypothetical protein F4802DRAFT_584124 [Xylaria palmicola]
MDWVTFEFAVEILRGAFRQLPDSEVRYRMEGLKPAWGIVRYRNHFRLLAPHCNRDHHMMTSELSNLMGNRLCSDDRDRVYATLAMTSSPYVLTPDYSLTVAEVFTQFAGRYSPNTQLFQAGLCRRRRDTHPATPIDISNRDYLPSWVPELRPTLNNAWAFPFFASYSTAYAAPCFFLGNLITHNAMHVGGTLFDVVQVVSWQYDDDKIASWMYKHKKTNGKVAFKPDFFFSITNQLQAILQSLSSDTNPVLKARSEPPWLTLAKALTGGVTEFRDAEYLLSRYPHFRSLSHLGPGSLPWLTAIWDRFSAHCFSPTGEVFQYVLIKALGTKPKELSTDGFIALGFLSYLANILVQNRLFQTMHGYLGLAPSNTKLGDFIAVLNGCGEPYVVRPAGKVKGMEDGTREDRTQGTEAAYVFEDKGLLVIGPCYLQGIMNGEIFTDRDSPQFSHVEWTRHDGDMADSLAGDLVLI